MMKISIPIDTALEECKECPQYEVKYSVEDNNTKTRKIIVKESELLLDGKKSNNSSSLNFERWKRTTRGLVSFISDMQFSGSIIPK